MALYWNGAPIPSSLADGLRDDVFSLESSSPLTVTGVLAVLDLSAGKGMLKTDLGKPIFFKISRPEQFNRFSIGERITVQLDEDGQAVKVIEALPAEIHEPPPAPH
jgi:hypothetical protein